MDWVPNILLIDDEVAIHRMFEVIFRGKAEVTCFEDGAPAIQAFQDGTFDLVVTDKNLPGELSGNDILREIRRLDSDISVIMITGKVDMPSTLDAIRNGVYDLIQKPFQSLYDLGFRIERALNQRKVWMEKESLIAQLIEANRLVEKANHELEAKVAERTKQLEELTLTDDVTGLYNQRFLYRRLQEEFHRAERFKHPLSVLMIDVDHFKSINDTHDHLFGSRVLRNIGQAFCSEVREIDFVIRYGGDEFCIILAETSGVEAMDVAERLHQLLKETNVGETSIPYYAGISIGVAAYPELNVLNEKELLRAADRALYAAKESGRNCSVVVDMTSLKMVDLGPTCERSDRVKLI